MAMMFRHMQSESSDRGAVETFFWGNHPRLSERIETVEGKVSRYPVNDRPPIAPGTDFDRRAQRVRVSNAQYDAFMGRMTLARTQVAKATDSVPPLLRPAAGEFFLGIMWGGAARGARIRLKDERLANELITTAIASLDRAAALATPRSPVLVDAYRVKGLMLYDWWTDARSKQCDSKPALEKYLELRPEAADRESIRTKITDLRWC